MPRYLAVIVLGLMSVSLPAGEWPQWRGLQRNAVAEESGLLPEWEHPPPVVWRADNLGDGYSSVAVAAGRVFTLGKFGDEVRCVCVDDANGKILWTTVVGDSKRHAMSTPTYAKGFVYPLDPDGELSCLNAETGDVIWSKNLNAQFGGKLMSGRGYGESPLVDGDRIVCTPGGPDAMMVSLDRTTGDAIWKAAIPNIGPKGSDGASFSSIVITEACGIKQYVQLTGRGLIGVDAATGKFLWGYNDICGGGINIPTPIVRGDLVFSANGYNAGSALVKLEPGGETGVTAREIYRLRGTDFQNHHGGVTLIGDHIYGGHGSNNGLPTCLDLATGKIVWKRRGPGSGSAAIAAADGRIVFRYQNGVVAWVAASPTGYSLHGMFEIPGTANDSWSHPAIANGRLYLREQSTLWVHDLVRPGSGEEVAANPQASAWSLELLALRGLGASLSRFPVKEQDWDALSDRQRIYRYAAESDAEAGLPLITLTDDHLANDGKILSDLFAALQAVAEPMLLSVGETALSDAGLKQLSGLKSLVALNVEVCPQLTEAGFAELADCQSLRVLIAAGTTIKPEGLQSLANLPDLAALDLDFCDHVGDTACVELQKFPALKFVTLKKTGFEAQRIKPEGIQKLAGIKSLESLDLTANDVTDAVLADLKALTNLRELTLNLVGVTDAGLAHLAEMKQLRRLRLLYTVGFFGPTLTDAGMPQLAKLPELELLDLTASGLTDAGLEQLAALKKLRKLDVAKTKVTAAGVEKFQQALPECRVKSSAVVGKKDAHP